MRTTEIRLTAIFAAALAAVMAVVAYHDFQKGEQLNGAVDAFIISIAVWIAYQSCYYVSVIKDAEAQQRLHRSWSKNK
jgi:hypothetical protein